MSVPSHLRQNSQDWLGHRRQGIGSSDAPIITGKSPYSTPYKLFLEKLGLKDPPSETYATEVGHRFEDRARAQFCLEMGTDCEPECVEHKDNPIFRASLDGLNNKDEFFLELKWTGHENFDEIKKTKKPLDHHFDQIQHQFLVTGYKKGYYVPYLLDGSRKEIEKIEIITVEPDEKYIAEVLIPKELEFWALVKAQTPPPLSAKDEKVVEDDLSAIMAKKYLGLKELIAKAETDIGVVENYFKNMTNEHPLVSCYGLKIQKVTRKGNVDYNRIPELEGIDLEQYRKGPSSFVKFSVPNK